jgi:AraC-like DNA-binding protein
MTSSEETLASIAETAGFASAFHLSSAFKKTHGVSPDIWRKQSQRPPA